MQVLSNTDLESVSGAFRNPAVFTNRQLRKRIARAIERYSRVPRSSESYGKWKGRHEELSRELYSRG